MALISGIYNNPCTINGNGKSKSVAKKNKNGKKLMMQANPLWDRETTKGFRDPNKTKIADCTVISEAGFMERITVHWCKNHKERYVKINGVVSKVNPVGYESSRLYVVEGVDYNKAPLVYL